MNWPFPPPIETMEAKVMEGWPTGRYAYEPKWDGFRVVSWSAPNVRLDSRNQRPLLRYFPELQTALDQLPAGTVVDGEVGGGGGALPGGGGVRPGGRDRLGRQAAGAVLRPRNPSHEQNQASAHGRLCRRWVPRAQR